MKQDKQLIVSILFNSVNEVVVFFSYMIIMLKRLHPMAHSFNSTMQMIKELTQQINDEYGHLMGDYVLREVAKLAKARIRQEEMFARYGGEEFCAVLPEVDKQGALAFAEDFRRIVAGHTFQFEGNTVVVTVSIGVAYADPSMKRSEALLIAADENLYKAKRAGRNMVVA